MQSCKNIPVDNLEEMLNQEIGMHYFKHFSTMVIWGYVVFPINGAVTILSALSTGQVATSALLSPNLFMNVSVATVTLSAINTYIQPQMQLQKNAEWMREWNNLGMSFEEIFYANKQNVEVDLSQPSNGEQRLEYEALMRKSHQLQRTQIADSNHFITDILYWGIHCCCFRKPKTWLEYQST